MLLFLLHDRLDEEQSRRYLRFIQPRQLRDAAAIGCQLRAIKIDALGNLGRLRHRVGLEIDDVGGDELSVAADQHQPIDGTLNDRVFLADGEFALREQFRFGNRPVLPICFALRSTHAAPAASASRESAGFRPVDRHPGRPISPPIASVYRRLARPLRATRSAPARHEPSRRASSRRAIQAADSRAARSHGSLPCRRAFDNPIRAGAWPTKDAARH